jgi:hypothetical protein
MFDRVVATQEGGSIMSEPGDFEVTELDDKDLEEVAGGLAQTGNTNCGCAPGYPVPSGDNNGNCGCSGTTPIPVKEAPQE